MGFRGSLFEPVEELTDLAAFADSAIDNDWIELALGLQRVKAATAEEAAFRLRIFNRLESAMAAQRIQETAALAALIGLEDREDQTIAYADLEVAIALRTGDRAAGNKIDQAGSLTGKLPLTMAKLRQGLITEWHALSLLKLADEAWNNGEDGDADYGIDLLAKCEAAIYAGLSDQPLVHQLRNRARRKMIAADPKAFANAHKKAAKRQDVTMRPDEFKGMAWICAYMPTADAATVMSAVQSYAAATRLGGDDRSAGELKCQALREWAEQFLTGKNAPKAHGRPIEIGIVASWETVMDLSDQPGDIPGYGPIPADVVRDLAREARARLLAADGHTGRLLDCGKTTYKPPVDLSDAVIITNPMSVGPFSETLSPCCDLDHIRAWDPDGETNFDNLAPLDRRIHRAKTLGGWHYEMLSDGSIVWITRLNQRIELELYKHMEPSEPAEPDP